jgi:hypothetical protein
MGKLIQLTSKCNCVSTPVTDIESDLAFLLVSPDLFARAIASSNYEMAMKVADQLVESSNAIGLYAIHKSHS